jgi:hypothetical protein
MFEVSEILKKESPPNLIVPDLATNAKGEPKWEENLRGRRIKISVEKGVILTEDQLLRRETP